MFVFVRKGVCVCVCIAYGAWGGGGRVSEARPFLGAQEPELGALAAETGRRTSKCPVAIAPGGVPWQKSLRLWSDWSWGCGESDLKPRPLGSVQTCWGWGYRRTNSGCSVRWVREQRVLLLDGPRRAGRAFRSVAGGRCRGRGRYFPRVAGRATSGGRARGAHALNGIRCHPSLQPCGQRRAI